MKNLLLLLLLISVVIFACKQAGTKLSFEAEAGSQLEKDSNAILDYLTKNNLTAETTESGLFYIVEKEGSGESPNASSYVTVHYTGTLLNGNKFDSSVDRGQPSSFPLGGVIKGWTEGVQLMKPGAKYKFLIPSELAYGKQAKGSRIPPNSPLVFDIELISFK